MRSTPLTNMVTKARSGTATGAGGMSMVCNLGQNVCQYVSADAVYSMIGQISQNKTLGLDENDEGGNLVSVHVACKPRQRPQTPLHSKIENTKDYNCFGNAPLLG